MKRPNDPQVPIGITANQLETIYDEPHTVPMRITLQMSMEDFAKLAAGEPASPALVRRLRWELAAWVSGAYKSRGIPLPAGFPAPADMQAALENPEPLSCNCGMAQDNASCDRCRGKRPKLQKPFAGTR
jgi:hypothetical protein